jgi:peptidoglycan/LPS O-acetylase OafA/YrhL
MNREPPTIARFAAFDGLRAIAALMVLTYHVTLWGGYSRMGPLAGAAAELKAGVAVFFVISGVLLYLPHARAIRNDEPPPSWRRYARRRVLRVLPAYWLALSVVAIGPFAAGVMNPDVWRFYGLTQIYDPGTIFSGLGVSWSLAVEVSFYAVLPLFAGVLGWAVRRLNPANAAPAQLSVILAVGAASIAFREILAGSPAGAVSNDLVTSATALPALMDWFAIGMAFAVLAADWEAGGSMVGWLARLARAPWACWLLALACFAAGIPFQGGDLFLTLYGPATHVAIGLAAGLFVLPAIAPGRSSSAFPIRLLTRPALAWLGTISYGIYLWHVPVLILLRGPFTPQRHPIGAFALTVLLAEVVAGAVVLGAASWYLLERPILRSRPPAPRNRPDLLSTSGQIPPIYAP